MISFLHTDLVNGLLGSVRLNSDNVPLLPGLDPQNSFLWDSMKSKSTRWWRALGLR